MNFYGCRLVCLGFDELIQNVDHQLNLFGSQHCRLDWFGRMHEDTSLIRNCECMFCECPSLADF